MLETLSTASFRNLATETVVLSGGLTFLQGENGAGKTNVLEAVAQLSGRPSFRGALPREIAREGSFTVGGVVCDGEARESLSASWSAGGPRRFERGGRVATFAEMGEALPGVFLCPEDKALFDGAPVYRRRFLDRLAIALFPAAAADYTRFARALRQRNALLSSRPANPDALEVWTEEFVMCASAVSARRRDALDHWMPEFMAALESTAGQAPITVALKTAGAELQVLRALARKLRAAEQSRGCSLFGPQRDDLEFVRDGRIFGASASSGEVKQTAFLLRIAEGAAIARASGSEPLYALDDFDADLSAVSAEALLACVPAEAQTILTTARPEAASFCQRKPDLVLEMRAGRAYPQPSRQQFKRIG